MYARNELNSRANEQLAQQESYLVHADQGDCLVHPGKLLHGGYPIRTGERYILAFFFGTPYRQPYRVAPSKIQPARRTSGIDPKTQA